MAHLIIMMIKKIHKYYFFIGIFAYLNYLTPKTRREIFETLIKGLQRLEYRGYDSAGCCISICTVQRRCFNLIKFLFCIGIGVDSPLSDGMCLIKESGKVQALEFKITASEYCDPISIPNLGMIGKLC